MYCVCWCDLDPIQGQGQPIGAFELPTISEAVHAGGDDRSPLAGLSRFILCMQSNIKVICESQYCMYYLNLLPSCSSWHGRVFIEQKLSIISVST